MSNFQERMKLRKQQIADTARQAALYDDPNSSQYRPRSPERTEAVTSSTPNTTKTFEELQQVALDMVSNLRNQAQGNTEAINSLVADLQGNKSQATSEQVVKPAPNINVDEINQRMIEEKNQILRDMAKAGQISPEELAKRLQADPSAQVEPTFISNLKDEKKVKAVNQKEDAPAEEPKVVPKLLNRANISKLDVKIKERVYGQDEVIDEVVNVLKSAFVSLKVNKKKPAGSYFFAGPSGVGKTELARSLADSLEVPILIINMGEYAQEFEISKLLGAPPGYLGYEQGGVIPNFIEKNPRGIIVFDEVEKAHPTADNILLSIMDQGVCQDNKGKDVHFKETIIISTSNLGASVEYIPGLTQEEKNEARMNSIKENLRPEIIGRYDSIFHFHSLKPAIYLKIVDKFLKGISNSAKEEHNLTLNFSEEIRQFIAEKSYDPALGGRPAGKFIEKVVVLPLADFMLRDDFEEQFAKHPEVTIDYNSDGNVFFRGNDGTILGVHENTASDVARIESNRFSGKKQESVFKVDPQDENTVPPKVSLRGETPAPAPAKTPKVRRPRAA